MTSMKPMTLYVPGDAAAVAVGADTLVAELAARAQSDGLDLRIVRNGSRGLLWLEPLVELDTADGRLGWGPVEGADLDTLWPALRAGGGGHPKALGLVERLPWLAGQQRRVFARNGRTDPLSLDDYAAHGGWVGLRRSLALGAPATLAQITESGLRGRGGAAFPAGIKWRTVHGAADPVKHVACNADEGDSGTYADRMAMEGDPYQLIEGLLIAGLTVGAAHGWIYVRSEYPHALAAMRQAIDRARAAGFLGTDAAGSGRPFDIELRRAAGSYVCGEETAMLESLEGRRGIVRSKPPLPALQGLFGQPTLIHNVITLASVPGILAEGAAAWQALGTGRSRGTLPIQLAGNLRTPGLVELPFGVTLDELVHRWGGGTASGRPVKAIQVGGPLGGYVPREHWSQPLDYETYAAFGGTVGHGGIVVHDDRADMARLARHAMAFCAAESCGKCTPCRIGSIRGVEVIDRIVHGPARERARQVQLLRDLCDTMTHGSACAMGGMTPNPVLSALEQHPEDFGLEGAPR